MPTVDSSSITPATGVITYGSIPSTLAAATGTLTDSAALMTAAASSVPIPGYLPPPTGLTLVGAVTGTGFSTVVTALAPTGVQPGTYPFASIVVDQTGRVISASSGSMAAAVSEVAAVGSAGIAITGSPITTAGTLSVALAPSGVSAGTYTLADIVVDTTGRIVSASSGSASGGGTTLPTSDGLTFKFLRSDLTWADSLGPNNVVTEDGSVAFGFTNTASTLSVAFGTANIVTQSSFAFGNSNTAHGTSIAFGNGNHIGAESFAFGNGNTGTNGVNIIIGSSNNVSGYGASVFGNGNTVQSGAFVQGQNNNAYSGSDQGAIIGNNSTLGSNAATNLIVGNSSTVESDDCLIVGNNNTIGANAGDSVALGSGINISNGACVGVGNNLTLSGYQSVAFGSGITATGAASFTIGANATDRGNTSPFIFSGQNANIVIGGTTFVGGGAQIEDYVFSGMTQGSVAVRLTADGQAPSATNVAQIGAFAAGLFDITLLGRDMNSGHVAAFSLTNGLISQGSVPSTTVIVGASFVAGPVSAGTPSQIVPTVTADTTNGGVNLTWTPQDPNGDNWLVMARLRMTWITTGGVGGA